ncbi:MAG: UDP-N-acetylmuramoyl-tripeptide--D-alanyl-D-alanine ligase [Desulfobacterales bacterium]|nr:UDP-N-acetylmuramoyl-tripeptide--D-alanyl-D-alanine ligase [Desulfobacterales bacterium]
MNWTSDDILEATGGKRLAGPAATAFDRVAIDSREIKSGELFVAIRGENHDGHQFVDDVVARGCCGVVVQTDRIASEHRERWHQAGVAVVGVDDTTRALGALAAYHRRRMPARIVALTGSNGKTTTRAMTASILQQGFNILATRGNLNNEIGVPLTLFRLTPDHAIGVIEMGMNHPGEIDRLGRMAAPDIGMITNVAPAHLEGLLTVEGVRDAKGELLDHIAPDGKAILNADDPLVRELAARSRADIIFYGQARDAHVRAEAIDAAADGTRFVLKLPTESGPVRLHIPGAFMVANALAAAAAADVLGLGLDAIQAGLAAVQPVAGRMQIQHLKGPITIINDCYNANPASAAAAIATLASLKGEARGFLVMGDMLELGGKAAALHRLTGERAGSAKLARLYAHGPHAEEVAAGARAAGMAADRILTGPVSAICSDLITRLAPGDWILVKGSRGMRMERVVEALTTWAEKGGEEKAP